VDLEKTLTMSESPRGYVPWKIFILSDKSSLEEILEKMEWGVPDTNETENNRLAWRSILTM
jgi:hypothetical protein